MHNEKIKKFIRQNSSLFWYIPEGKKEEISEEVLVETILNYGDMEAVRELMNLMGVDKVAGLFFDMQHKSERRKGNIHEITAHFFTEFFKRHAHRSPQ